MAKAKTYYEERGRRVFYLILGIAAVVIGALLFPRFSRILWLSVAAFMILFCAALKVFLRLTHLIQRGRSITIKDSKGQKTTVNLDLPGFPTREEAEKEFPPDLQKWMKDTASTGWSFRIARSRRGFWRTRKLRRA